MPKPWPDPRDPEQPPSKLREFLVYLAAAVIAAGVLVNLVRGLIGQGWNW